MLGVSLLLQLNFNNKIEVLIIALFSVFQIITFSYFSSFIPLIEDKKAYIPDDLDDLRTAILSAVSSLIINFAYRYISIVSIIFKILLEFLSFYLLAYPQKQEKSRTYSDFNLTVRQSFLFGVVYQAVSLGFYFIDHVRYLSELEKDSQNNLDQLNELLESRSKLTLSHCLQVRRNSSNLRKILYQIGQSSNTTDDEENLLTNSTIIISEDLENTTSALTNEPFLIKGKRQESYGSITSLFKTESSNKLIDVTNGTFPDAHKFKYEPSLLHLLWIVSSSFYETGISLILSIPYIFIPGLTHDYHFTQLEQFFYGKIGLFSCEILMPLTCIVSLMHYLLHENFYKARSLIIVYSFVSATLFAFGWFSSE